MPRRLVAGLFFHSRGDRRASFGQLGLDRADRASENPGYLGLGKILVVPEHHGFALSWWKLPDEFDQHYRVIAEIRRVSPGSTVLVGPRDSIATFFGIASAQFRPAEVDHARPQVPLRPLGMTYAPPTGECAKERLLDNLFGSSAVIEQQTGETTQSSVVLVEQTGYTLVPVVPGSAIASVGRAAELVVFALRSRAFCHEELEPERLTNSGKFTGIASHVNRRTGFERHISIDVSPSP